MPPNSATQWHSINDFTPGIRSKLSGKYPVGTAAPTNTWGCYADDSGALVPLPLQFRANILHDNTTVVTPANNAATEIRVIGLQAVGPINHPSDVTPGDDQNDTNVFVMYESYPTTIPTGRKFELWRYTRDRLASPAWEKVWSRSMGVAYNAAVRPESFMMGLTRTHHSDPTTTGTTVLVFVADGIARMFPDEDTATTNSTRILPGDIDDPINTPDQIVIPDMMALHQGRVIIFQLTVPPFGANSAQNYHNESMYFTAYNDLRALGSGAEYGAITVGPENPTGYAAAHSLTANELFMIKKAGGAVLISGDVTGVGPSSPTARTLPYVKSPGLARNNGTRCPVGMVYPVDGDGAWLWQGGDFSQPVSKQLAVNFWKPPQTDSQGAAVTYGDHGTSCASFSSFSLFPNNWIWDYQSKSWWQTNDPSIFVAHQWAVDYRGRKVYQARSGWKLNTDPVVKEYDTFSYASQYSWQCQPISDTVDSTVAIKEVAIVAMGTGTVAITVTSGQDTSGQTSTFTIAATTAPVVLRQSFDVRGSHIVIKAVAHSDDYNAAAVHSAPTIYEIRYGSIVQTLTARNA